MRLRSGRIYNPIAAAAVPVATGIGRTAWNMARPYVSALGAAAAPYVAAFGRSAASQAGRQAVSMLNYGPTRRGYGGRMILTKKQKRRVRREVKAVKAAVKRAKTSSCCSRIAKLEKAMEASTSRHVKRHRETSRLIASAGGHAWGNWLNTVANLEAAIDDLKFFDPSNPGTKIAVDFTAGTVDKSVNVSERQSLLCRNNYGTPLRIEIWELNVKQNNSTAPTTLTTSGLSDNSNTLTQNHVLSKIGDYTDLNTLWYVKRLKKATLQPGEEIVVKRFVKGYKYSPNKTDAVTGTYTREAHNGGFLVRIIGCIGHDTAANEQNVLGCGIDVDYRHNYHITYDSGGGDFRFLELIDLGPSFTNPNPQQDLRPGAEKEIYNV